MSRHPKPLFDFEGATYVATVRVRSCPGYAAPYGQGGHKQGRIWYRGQEVEIVMAEDCGTYVCGLTRQGTWINLWCLYNNLRQPVGVHFCGLARVETV